MPHQYAEAWLHPTLGRARMELDIAVCGEIIEQINESTEKSRADRKSVKNKAKGAMARRAQRRRDMGVE